MGQNYPLGDANIKIYSIRLISFNCYKSNLLIKINTFEVSNALLKKVVNTGWSKKYILFRIALTFSVY